MKRNLNKSVMSKIAGITKDKVELKSEVVELASFANPKTQIDKAEKLNSEVLDYANKIYKLKQAAKKPSQKAVELSQRIITELEADKKEFISKVKELGIDFNKLDQPKEYDRAIKRVEALSKNIRKMSDEINK